MNIQEAKNEIVHTLQAYLRKDDTGAYIFPGVHQRPIVLMGPPGVGKTAIMEQAAAQCGVALVAYTITHHTRQSAIGLPHIERRTYGGVTMSVTEYTMSEIIASVYEAMERTGKKEGILFLDEINCVSETLAPTMLQFLQNKTFGTHTVPEGWVLAAAGNPSQYNKSAREFDVVTLDRVRLIEVEADLPVWLEYARRKGLHGAILSYLSAKPDRFYSVERKDGALSFVTARGWEDLSQILVGYEQLEVPITEGLVAQYLRRESTARDFAAYYRLYRKYASDYGIGALLAGTLPETERQQKVRMASQGSFDERVTVVNLILERLQVDFREYCRTDEALVRLHGALSRFRGYDKPLEAFLADCRRSLEVRRENGLLDSRSARQEAWVLRRLEAMALSAREEHLRDHEDQFAHVKALFGQDLAQREEMIRTLHGELDRSFRFVTDCFGDGQELVLLMSHLTRMPEAQEFIRRHGCEGYLAHAPVLLYRRREEELRRACKELL